jgi:hypothetical protein
MADWKKWYPILVKYNAPVKIVTYKDETGECPAYRVLPEDLGEWKATLPKDWPEMFSSVMGSVTWDGTGYYLIDIADTLYALERGWEYRGGF